MQVNSVTSFNYGQAKLAHKAVDAPQPEQKPVEDQGVTASIYFGQKENKNGMRKAAMAGLGSLMLFTTIPTMTTSCDKDRIYVEERDTASASATANASASATANAILNIHPRGCACDSCCHGRDTVYKYVTDTVDRYIYLPGDTIKLPGDTIRLPGDTVRIPIEIPETVYVDTGSYHVTHDTIYKWKCDFKKPIPLDTLDKWVKKFDIDGPTPGRRNIVNYQGIREWEYGQRFVADANLLESSKNIMVYDREDLDWLGNHKGWGKDVYRIPTSRFTIQTYSGKKLNSPKGTFFETYVNPNDEKATIYDNNLVQRYFFQTDGDSVKVYSYDAKTGLYREDGRMSKGYLDKSSVGSNILLTDLIASDPTIKWSTNPEYSTEDHLVGCKVVTLNDEELRLLYVRQRDDEFAEQHYGKCDN